MKVYQLHQSIEDILSFLALLTHGVRDWFIREKDQIFNIYIFLVALAAILCIFIRYGDIMQDALMDKDNLVYKSDEHIREMGFSDFMRFPLKCPGGVKRKDLRSIIEITEDLKKRFGAGVASVSTGIRNGHYQATNLYNPPYVTARDLDSDDFRVGSWMSYMRKDPAWKLLIDEDTLYILVALEEGYSDDEIGWEVKRLLEKRRRYSLWEIMTARDFYPVNKFLLAAGWPLAKWLLTRTNFFEMFTRSFGGLFLAFLLFRIILKRWRMALVSTMVIGTSMLWMRGSITLLNLGWKGHSIAEWIMGQEILERVYILAAFTNCIVQGISFSLHKFEEYIKTGDWYEAKSVDKLILNTGIITFFGFITLFFFQVRSIRELGILSALGVVYLFLLSVLFIPALYDILTRISEALGGLDLGNRPGAGRIEVAGLRAARGLAMAFKVFEGLIDWLSVRYDKGIDKLLLLAKRGALMRPWKALTANAVILVLLICMLQAGMLKVGTRPLEYIKGTLPQRTAQYVNVPGRGGFAAQGIFIEPREGLDLYDPGFMMQVSMFQDRLVEMGAEIDYPVYKDISVVDFMKKLYLQKAGREIPGARSEVRLLLGDAQKGSTLELWYQMLVPEGVRVLAFVSMDDSVKHGQFIRGILELRKEFPDLKIYPFGKGALYPEEDRYVREGKIWNAIASEFVVILFCMLLLVQKSRELRSKRLNPILGGVFMGMPFLFAGPFTFIVMMVIGVPLDVATAIITAMAIGASVDFSIFYADSYQEGLVVYGRDESVAYAMENKGRVVINDIFLNSVAFFVLISSSIIPMHRLGWVMVLMIFACGFGSLVLMASIIRLAVDRCITGFLKRKASGLL